MMYVVTGFPRSGTSSVMQGLKLSGVDILYDPNRGEKYEISFLNMKRPNYLYRHAKDGIAVKLPTPFLLNLPPVDSTLIWMHRDPVKIRASYEKRFGQDVFAAVWFNDGWVENYNETTKAMRAYMEDRKSVKEIIDIEFNDLIENPTYEFSRIPGVDAKAAALAINYKEAA